ncbi:hypothetical protein EJD96_16080 [Herbaspirillum seropedicae]|uniref:hypothetical protein n=1 Tax=Herbaspirillum seropedicae TaxID=964 RepID=UPI00111E1625|nr:hypothetical protein [Herbaspirillum seropedicae]QDD65567.1 hypothetical protein EJD96_16080 [Herbaspirillum seropedicae]
MVNTNTGAKCVKVSAPETGAIKNVSDQLTDLMVILFEKSNDRDTKAFDMNNLIGLAVDLSCNINKMLGEVEAAEEAAEAAQ